jgi:hypothetical protein
MACAPVRFILSVIDAQTKDSYSTFTDPGTLKSLQRQYRCPCDNVYLRQWLAVKLFFYSGLVKFVDEKFLCQIRYFRISEGMFGY